MNEPLPMISSHHRHSPDNGSNAIYVRNASKSYGVGKRRSSVFQNLDMVVKQGHIYGLLGASGCGKTTLLSCIVGRRSFDSGQVLVFGGEPGTPESGIPGRRVGYMPQELALYGVFTIKETLQYFGRLYNLSPEFVKSRMEFLFNLLDLPPGHRLVGTLSGGQQRRVSFAVALFHDPELLILDEPTVGVDPLLRRSIWNHLISLSTEHGRTVIITTHYIEEARQANTVGMMRSGRLLAQDSPENLLAIHCLPKLEDVFLKLCMKDVSSRKSVARSKPNVEPKNGDGDEGQQDNLSHLSIVSKAEDMTINRGSSSQHPVEVKRRSRTFNLTMPSTHRTSALILKNFAQTFREIGMFLFIFILPASQAIIFCLAIGRDPTSLKLAIVNEELDPSQGNVCSYINNCTQSMYSCRYLRHLNNETIVQVPYSSYTEALEAMSRSELWGVIHFGPNFTDELAERLEDGRDAKNKTIQSSQIAINLDWSNQYIAFTLQKRTIDAFDLFAKDIQTSCDRDESAVSIPTAFLDPIYGTKEPSFTDFMAPGVILTIVFIMAVGLTATVIISERRQGLIDRSLMAGVQAIEILVAHVVNQFTILVGQTGLVYLFMILVFKITCHGSLFLAIIITLLQGLCGMCYGMVVSSMCDEEISAIQLAMGSFMPIILLCGVMWPLEGMPVFLRYFSYFLPQTYAVESLRNIFARGWGIQEPEVYLGIIISIGWIFALLICSLGIIRIRKYTG